ncbi:MAG: ComEC/Rec2 family competence protein [Patescibacteria group bacterium]
MLGILLRSFIFLNIFIVLLIGVTSVALFLFFLVLRNFSEAGSIDPFNKWGIICSICILAFSLGIIRFHSSDTPPPEFFESKVGTRVDLHGVISDGPDIRENNQKLTIEVGDDSNKTKILITTNLYDEFKYGDELKISGKLEKPENFITDQGKEFDYVNYLRKDGILYTMNYGDIEVVSEGNGNFIKSTLFYVKGKFIERIDSSIYHPENLLMGGLILGEKSQFSNELRNDFITTGTIHIVALSGYNVTIVAEWIMKIFSFLPLYFGLVTGMLTIILFVLMTGASSTAIRAGIMALLVLLARLTGRNYDVARALILAAVGMLLINPFILVYDVSFQLSFIATVAVIFFTPRIEKYFLWVTERFGLRDIFSVTTAAYIFVFPFILYKMGSLSLVALPANILVLPFIPFTMLLGFITGFVGLFYYLLAIPFGFISYILLHYELGVISFLADIPFASVSIPNFPLFITILIYVYFIYLLFGRSIKSFFVGDL